MKTEDYTKKVYTPGALRVAQKFLNNTSDKNSQIQNSEIIRITNQKRADNGKLQPLTENIILDQTAKEKVDDMFKRQYFEHISPQKIGVGDLAQENGYDYITIGENLALGNFKSEEDLLNAWMNSPGHRANILSKKFTEIGVYAKKGIFKGQEVWLAVQHFGLSLSNCPQIDETLKSQISAEQKKVDELASNLETMKDELDKNSMLMYVYGSKKQEQVKEYNDLADRYNNFVKEIKNNISEYNKQVQSLNDCIQSELAPE
jgi:uncharacterized protein YkwD/chaperonin cofactor prefoldin